MLKNEHKQYNLYSILYDKIPANHILRTINSVVDFSFINELLESSYCKYYGRPAKEPEMMAKFLILQYMYNLSDVRVIEETRINLAYMWFVGINPDEDLPDPSLLAKFRTERLQETSLDEIIKEVVRQCVEKGIIKGTSMSVDCTHTKANTIKKVPERIMKHLAQKIFTNLEKENGSLPEGLDTNIPEYKEIKDHQIAKSTMKEYLENVIQHVEKQIDSNTTPKTQQVIQKAKEVLADPKFIQQKGIRSLVDEEARVGYKSKTDSFFGYKVEFALIPEERIITAISVHNGAYVDGTDFNKLYNQTKECKITIKRTLGDKAYFRKPILSTLKEDSVEAIIPVSESVYRIDESTFSYNKDSDQWFCKYGNCTGQKKKTTVKNQGEILVYDFDKERCSTCPERTQCAGARSKRKRFRIGINTPEFYEYSQIAKTDEFKEKYKDRACHEWKNGEMKRFHGLDRARGYGLKSMLIQAQLTALAVNLKRIARLVSSVLVHILIKKLYSVAQNKYVLTSA